MRDPLTWSLPMGRLFGITIRVHLLFPLVALGLIVRAAYQKDVTPGLWIEASILMGLLFVSVLLHEFGHCFGARAVDGDAQEIMLWPLGGLANVEVPHTPRANFLCTAAGPAVNLLLCLLVCLVLAANGLVPSFKPWADPYTPQLYRWSESTWYASKTGRGDLWQFSAVRLKGGGWVPAHDYDPSAGLEKNYEFVPINNPDEVVPDSGAGKKPEEQFAWQMDKEKVAVKAGPVAHAVWLVLLARLFWVNWFLFLLNLVPAFPLDGGRLLQSLLWWRGDYRQATGWAIFAGFGAMFVFILVSIIVYEPLILLLAIFMYVSCRRQWILLETGGEESLFGYDFSQGYTSLERDQPAPPRRRQSWWKAWMQRRAERRMRREQEQREAEERRMDELLEKVQRLGLQALTDEERRFLTRVSAKYRNRQG